MLGLSCVVRLACVLGPRPQVPTLCPFRASAAQLAVSSTLREMVVCWEEAAEGGGLLKLSRLDLGQLGPLAPLLHQQGLVAVDLTSLLSGS